MTERVAAPVSAEPVAAKPMAAERPVAVAVLAKAPIPGYCKTRLALTLGPRGAARLQRTLLRRAVATALEARTGPVTLWCAPDASHPSFRALHRAWGVTCATQPTGDLGVRMAHVFAEAADARGTPLLLLGSDCPALTPAHLRLAATHLRQGFDAFVQPAEDGGYVMIGFARPATGESSNVFERIDWSTPQVMEQTRQRLADAGLRWIEGETLWDIDLPADLARWQATPSHSSSPSASMKESEHA
ncbi:MAG: TIGR04282 family arsenosugar biosynthesis glycosyltransferase [Variovorax sp.]